ncbi:MAG: UDP-3-O-acyl-N-acetylglucosamine deacetylase [Fuerstiella sp.]|nr:UDP-3-O-acyl-N-acetylglucosamine deacetylase [Fuerstiella sp.]
MNKRLQQTLAGPVELEGPGLFHGVPARIRLLPAEAGTGILFRRCDLTDFPTIPARHDYVLAATRRTILGIANQPIVETVEHLMAAMAGMGVDNCLIEINAPEVPSFDASSRVFCDAILDIGLQKLSDRVESFVVTDQMVLGSEDGQTLLLRPYVRSLLAVTWQLDYGRRAAIQPQTYSAEITPDTFVREIASARTFVLESEIAALKGMGYGRHLTDADLLVCGIDGTWNNRLRWPDECVRHKLLDCIGDLALCGVPLCGHLTAVRSGHKLNHRLAAEVSRLAGSESQPVSSAA